MFQARKGHDRQFVLEKAASARGAPQSGRIIGVRGEVVRLQQDTAVAWLQHTSFMSAAERWSMERYVGKGLKDASR